MNQIKTRSFGLYVILLVLGGVGAVIEFLGFLGGAFGIIFGIIGLILWLVCSISCIVMLYTMMKDINVMCRDDGEELMNYVLALLLGLITFGIYLIYYYYRVQTRLHENSRTFNVEISESGGTFLLWYLLGSLLFGLGPFIAFAIMFRSFNKLAYGYNRQIASGLQKRIELQSKKNEQVVDASPLPATPKISENDRDITMAVNKFSLHCDSGVFKGGDFDLPDEITLSMGRDSKSVNLVLKDEGISRVHCVLSRKANQIFVEDHSTNGTFVNGKRVEKERKIALRDGDKLQIGKTDNTFTITML